MVLERIEIQHRQGHHRPESVAALIVRFRAISRRWGLNSYSLGFDHDDARFDQDTADKHRRPVGTRLMDRDPNSPALQTLNGLFPKGNYVLVGWPSWARQT